MEKVKECGGCEELFLEEKKRWAGEDVKGDHESRCSNQHFLKKWHNKRYITDYAE